MPIQALKSVAVHPKEEFILTMTTPPPNAGKPVAPAPPKVEEEDLDELDDLLDQFTPAPPSKPTASTSTTSPPADAFTEDFEAALAREMEAMMRGESSNTNNTNEDMATAWQKLLVGDLEGTNTQPDMSDLFKNLGVDEDKDKDKETNPDDAFQRTIRQAMDKLKTSDESAKASGPTDEFAELLKQLGQGEQDEEGIQGMIEGMMGQLMSKEILYEPLVEMNDKFPGYFVAHPELPEAELKRFKAQEAIVRQLVEIYQKPDYSDDNAEANKEVLRLMNEVCWTGCFERSALIRW
ncbi:Pex19-domain protein [Rhizoctonia solani 123E]|uniref:Pex19-domain protein n=1 Tax=Rhizoctonia solani 123E TaxID=1423351 RepID=A0A074RRD7_9AGAM|nr:Pex19-domain protein [Rhizoctonia solani 123E]